MDAAAIYRTRAAEERAKAAATPLVNRRVMYERAADAWDVMALQIEDTVAFAAVNQAAKNQR